MVQSTFRRCACVLILALCPRAAPAADWLDPSTWPSLVARPPADNLTSLAPAGGANVAPDEHITRTWPLGPECTLRIRGRVDTDFIASSQSAANVATFGDLGDVAGLRRARIGVEG